MKMNRLFTAAALSLALSFPGIAAAVGMADFAENKTVDALLRGQVLAAPATGYIALYTTCPTDSSAGIEVTGGSYARVAITASLANWSGTQSAGSTLASSGTGGTVSNNVAITYVTPTATWNLVNCWGYTDALTGGNLWFYSALTIPKTINNGDTVAFPIGAASIQIDN